MSHLCLKPPFFKKTPLDCTNSKVSPYASLVPPNPFLICACVANKLSPFCIPTAVAAGCVVICRTSLWDSHLIALLRVALLGIWDSLEPFAVRSSLKQILPVDIRG